MREKVKDANNKSSYQAAVGIKMGSGACERGNLRSESMLILLELLKSRPKLSSFSCVLESSSFFCRPSGGLVTIGALSLVGSECCLWKIPMAIFASLGMFLRSGLLSVDPICLYISSGSTRNRYMYLSPWIFLRIPLW